MVNCTAVLFLQEMYWRLEHYGAFSKKTSHLLNATWLSSSVITLITSNYGLTSHICFTCMFYVMYFTKCNNNALIRKYLTFTVQLVVYAFVCL